MLSMLEHFLFCCCRIGILTHCFLASLLFRYFDLQDGPIQLTDKLLLAEFAFAYPPPEFGAGGAVMVAT